MARYPGAITFTFGESAAMNAQILALVRGGKKTVTCAAMQYFDESGETVPETGRTDIALDWDGSPALAVRTVDVLKMPFEQMSEDLVTDHGEFSDLTQWREAYKTNLIRAGHFNAGLMMLVERFEVIEDFQNGETAHV